jgi:hypothetical protein
MNIIVDCPGDTERKRGRKVDFYDYIYGEQAWEELWRFEDQLIDFSFATKLYEDSYREFFKSNQSVLDWVLSFGDCYQFSPQEVECGDAYDKDSCPRHLQDVVIRRVVHSMNLEFKGSPEVLLQTDHGCDGESVCAGNVPFLYPSQIYRGKSGGPKPRWAKDGSVEHFWQSNKVIVAETLSRNSLW